LNGLRARLAAELDRIHRLAQFYLLTDEAERLEEMQSTRAHSYFADSGAAEACENGLRQLGVFEHEDWWDHLPEDDLDEQQRAELREDVYHHLLLLALIRAKRALPLLGKQEATTLAQSGLEVVAVANRFRPDGYAGRRLEALLLLAGGRGDEIQPFTAHEPTSGTDHYFSGLAYLGIALVFNPANGQPLATKLFVQQAARLAGLDVQQPTEKAMFHLHRAADLRRRHYWAHCWLGSCLNQAGRADAAELAFDTCVALRPDYALGHLLRAEAIIDQWAAARDPRVKDQLFERALKDFARAVDLDPREAATYECRGLAHDDKGNQDRAIADFTQAIALAPADGRTYNYRGNAYHRKGDYDRAVTDYTEALRLLPKEPTIYANRGASYFSKREYDRALADYTAALDLDPKYVQAYRNRAYTYYQKGDYPRAVEDYTETLRLDRKDATSWKYRGKARSRLADYEGAIADAGEAIRLAAKDVEAYEDRGTAYAARGEHDRAIADFTAVIKLAPRDAAAYSSRAGAFAAKGRWVEAAADFGRLTELQPDDAMAWYYRAIAHLAARDLPAYRRDCSMMLERFGATRDPAIAARVLYACVPGPDAVEMGERLTALADLAVQSSKANARLAGAVAYRRGLYEQAVGHFDEAAKELALRPRDWLFLAMAHQRLGHPGEARQFLARAVAWIDEADKPGAGEGKPAAPSWSGWFERVEVQSLRREAEALLGDAPPVDRK
jgi:tetratricopeptide (TPR) repeat protein